MIGNKYASEELAKNFLASVSKIKQLNKQNYSKIVKEAGMSHEDDAADYLMDEDLSADGLAKDPLDGAISSLSDDKESNCNMCGYAHDVNAACDVMGSKSAAAKKSMKKVSKKCPGCKSSMKSCKCSEARDTDNVASQSTFNSNALHAEDHKKAKYVASQLAKIAKGLKSKGHVKEANVVLNTAKEIVGENTSVKSPTNPLAMYVDKKASFVASELTKIAHELRSTGNGFAADMVDVTNAEIQNEAIVKASGKAAVVSELIKMANQSYSEGDAITADVIQATILSIKRG
jgi:hypothetical protein